MIEIHDEAGRMALACRLFRCWVSEARAMPDADAKTGAVAIQTLTLENEGWERAWL